MLNFSVFLLAFLFVETGGNSSWNVKLAQRDLYAISHANNYFAFNLHKRLAEDTKGNIFFSPFSVSSALSMLYLGARGETAKELRKVLGYRRINDSTVFSSFNYYLTEVMEKANPKLYALNSVSALVVDNSIPVLEQYKKNARDIFHAFVQEADIAEEGAAVADRINTWAKIKTKGAIDNLATLDPEMKFYLASAAYFKGSWRVKFDPKNTKYHPFYNRGQRTDKSNVLMMHAHAMFKYYEGDEDTFTAIELLYEGRNMSMVIYLPNQYDGLGSIEEDMSEAMMMFVRRQMYYMKVHLTMPKFKLEYDVSLRRPLQDIGVTKIFRWAESNLSRMIAEGATLAATDVKHKAVIEVNEKGSVASAITRVIMTKSMPSQIPDPEFKVDHPFLFTIFDIRSGMILFMGRVTNF